MDFALSNILGPHGVLLRARLYAPDASTVTDLALVQGSTPGIYSGTVTLSPVPPYSADPYTYEVREVSAQTTGAFNASTSIIVTPGVYGYSDGAEWFEDATFEASPAIPADATHRAEKWSVVTPPTSRPVTWAEAKVHLRLTDDTEQAYVESLIDAAVDFAEDAMQCSLMARTLLATFYAGERLVLPRGPLLEVLSITAGASETAVTEFQLTHVGTRVCVVPTTAAEYPVSVVYRAGYASAVSAGLKLTLKMLVSTWYENRESVSDKSKLPVPHSVADFFRLKGRGSVVG